MRILLIPSGDWFSPLPTRHKFMTDRLTSKGHEVHVLRIATWSGKTSGSHASNGVIVHELRGSPHSDRVTGNEILHYATRTVAHARVIKKILVSESIDVVLSSNLLPSAAAMIVSKIRGIPVVYDVIDFFPDFVLRYKDDGFGLEILRFTANKVFEFNLRHADRILVPGRASADFLARSFLNGHGSSSKPVAILPNGISPHLFENGHDLRKHRESREGNGAGLKVGLIGSLEFWVDTKFIVDFLTGLRNLDPTARFIIYGGKPESSTVDIIQELRSRLEVAGLADGLSFRGFVPYEQMCRELSSIQIGLVPFRTDLRISQYAFPLKVLEYMAAGAVVVSTPIQEVMDLAQGVAVIEKEGSVAARKAFSLCKDPSRLSDLIEKGAHLARRYNWDDLSAKLERELLEAVNGNHQTKIMSR